MSCVNSHWTNSWFLCLIILYTINYTCTYLQLACNVVRITCLSAPVNMCTSNMKNNHYVWVLISRWTACRKIPQVLPNTHKFIFCEMHVLVLYNSFRWSNSEMVHILTFCWFIPLLLNQPGALQYSAFVVSTKGLPLLQRVHILPNRCVFEHKNNYQKETFESISEKTLNSQQSKLRLGASI